MVVDIRPTTIVAPDKEFQPAVRKALGALSNQIVT